MKSSRFPAIWLVIIALLSCPALSLGQPNALGDQVSGALDLSTEEKVALEPVLAHYYAMNGSKPILQEIVTTGAECGCRGTCMADVLGMVNQLMKAGVSNEEAGAEVLDALKAVNTRCEQREIKPSTQEIGRAVRSRVEAKYKEQKKVIFSNGPSMPR